MNSLNFGSSQNINENQGSTLNSQNINENMEDNDNVSYVNNSAVHVNNNINSKMFIGPNIDDDRSKFYMVCAENKINALIERVRQFHDNYARPDEVEDEAVSMAIQQHGLRKSEATEAYPSSSLAALASSYEKPVFPMDLEVQNSTYKKSVFDVDLEALNSSYGKPLFALGMGSLNGSYGKSLFPMDMEALSNSYEKHLFPMDMEHVVSSCSHTHNVHGEDITLEHANDDDRRRNNRKRSYEISDPHSNDKIDEKRGGFEYDDNYFLNKAVSTAIEQKGLSSSSFNV